MYCMYVQYEIVDYVGHVFVNKMHGLITVDLKLCIMHRNSRALLWFCQDSEMLISMGPGNLSFKLPGQKNSW